MSSDSLSQTLNHHSSIRLHQGNPAMLARHQRKTAFTLVEMLVVIGIIGILAAILLPAVTIVRRKVAKATTQSTIANLETAIAMFQKDWGLYPPHSYTSTDPKIYFPGTNVAIPQSSAFKLCDNAADRDYNNRALMFFLTSQFEYTNAAGNEKKYGPYFSPKEKQMLPGKTTLSTHSITGLKVTLWNGTRWTSDSSNNASAKLNLKDGFSMPFFYYSNQWAAKQTGALTAPHKPFSYVLFSTGENMKTAWNDGIDNDNDGSGDGLAEEKFDFVSTGRYLTACGKEVGQDRDDIHNW